MHDDAWIPNLSMDPWGKESSPDYGGPARTQTAAGITAMLTLAGTVDPEVPRPWQPLDVVGVFLG